VITKGQAINSLYPKAQWVIKIDGVLEWHSTDITQPTDAEIQTELTRLEAEYDAQSYARSRKQEYDKLPQFEMQFDDQRDNTTTWVDSINEIKVRFPK